ncbi:MAG: nucleotidyltransferase domain-containing protein, partial [Bacteroidota bacterium]
HKVDKLFAFGSVVGPAFDAEKSDLDFLVVMMDVSPLEKGELLLSLWDKLEDLFKLKVDLLSINSISNPYLQKSIDASKVLIYDRSSQKVFS